MEPSPSRAYRLAVVNSHPIQYFAPLYRRLAAEPGIDLTVYFCCRAGVARYVDEGFGGEVFAWDVPLLDGYDHVFLRNVRGERAPGGFWSLVNPSIVRALRRGRYDAVWLHGHGYASCLLALLGARTAGSALFMRCETHLLLRRTPARRALRGLVMPAFYSMFDACLAIGTRNAEFYRRLGVPEEKIFLVPYAVENRRFEEGARLSEAERVRRRQEFGLPPPEVPVVLFLSKLMPRKRPMDLLRAFRGLQSDEELRAALVFVGAGTERPRMERFIERHEVPDVHFLGFRNQAELPAIYGVSDVFVLPSEDEPWGLVVNEAMAAGLPVVVSAEVGAAADLVLKGQNGFKFPAGDSTALAERLRLLLADVDLRRRMGRASREIIAAWNLEACVYGVGRALESICGVRKSAEHRGSRSKDPVISRG